jgi:Tfp pilus assembly protein PilF
MTLRVAVAAALAVQLASCAQLREAQEALLWSKGRSTLSEAVRQYDDGQHLAAAKSLQAALDLGLKDGERATAHKHLAFIHCAAGRTAPCREEFRQALSAAPALELTPAEAGHPVWGPVFRAAKSEGGSLSIGLKQYDDGDYDASAKSLQVAIDRGLSPRERAIAHKHLAFVHCAASRERACRDEFGKALALEPALELTPAEAGHPVWGPAFKAAKADGDSLAVALKQYGDGEYDASAKNFQVAIERGLPPRDRVNAHKHLAFIHCANSRERACRDEFRKALAIDPALDLAPAEAGHPVWGPVFRSLKDKK